MELQRTEGSFRGVVCRWRKRTGFAYLNGPRGRGEKCWAAFQGWVIERAHVTHVCMFAPGPSKLRTSSQEVSPTTCRGARQHRSLLHDSENLCFRGTPRPISGCRELEEDPRQLTPWIESRLFLAARGRDHEGQWVFLGVVYVTAPLAPLESHSRLGRSRDSLEGWGPSGHICNGGC